MEFLNRRRGFFERIARPRRDGPSHHGIIHEIVGFDVADAIPAIDTVWNVSSGSRKNQVDVIWLIAFPFNGIRENFG